MRNDIQYHGCKERPALRRMILRFCDEKNITLEEMYDNYPCIGNLKKQLKKMIFEEENQKSDKEIRINNLGAII